MCDEKKGVSQRSRKGALEANDDGCSSVLEEGYPHTPRLYTSLGPEKTIGRERRSQLSQVSFHNGIGADVPADGACRMTLLIV